LDAAFWQKAAVSWSISLETQVERNFTLIVIKLDAHDKIWQKVVEQRIETPQVARTLIWLGCASASRTEASRQIRRTRHLIS
jgi:hypothetical protein